MNWEGKPVLVTGGGGFIGSHLVERLITLGANTRTLVNYRSDGSWGWLDGSSLKSQVDVVQGDIRDASSVASAIAGSQIVFHLAALISIPYSYQSPLSYVRTNVEGSANVFQSALQLGVERIVHTSTSETYGTAKVVPIDEEHPLQGQSPYSASKIGADKLAEAFCSAFGLPVVTIRPFNTYGPRQSGRAVIPTIITQVLTSNQISLGNLSPTRDFNYVADTVDGFIKIAETPGLFGEVVNIGSGNEISISDLVDLVISLTSRSDVRIVQKDSRVRPEASEVDRLCADSSKAFKELGWLPKYTLSEGLMETIAWINNNLEKYRVGTYDI